jgi:L-ascorbate metabolism protein UlaG (beta-lactamase superfamily)
MKLTYLGHSSVLVETAEARLLFDPYITQNPLASAIDITALKPNYVLLTHGHFDHLADAESILKYNAATLIANFEIATWYGNKGINHVHGMNVGGAFGFPFGRVKYVNAVHSSMLPDGSYGGAPGGYVVESNQGGFYVSGDTALTLDMKLLGERHSLSFAVLCIGDNLTMGPEDAALAAEWLGVKRVIGVHYDTFPSITLDRESAVRAFADRGIELLLPAIGETLEL